MCAEWHLSQLLHSVHMIVRCETTVFSASHSVSFEIYRVPTAQGKQGKWQKKIPVRETGNSEILPKHG